MNTHRPINIGLALALALLLSSAYMLDKEDNSSEWDTADELAIAQAAADFDTRIQKAAQQLCDAERGPNSEARWTEDNKLVCTTRRGVKVAGGAL